MSAFLTSGREKTSSRLISVGTGAAEELEGATVLEAVGGSVTAGGLAAAGSLEAAKGLEGSEAACAAVGEAWLGGPTAAVIIQ